MVIHGSKQADDVPVAWLELYAHELVVFLMPGVDVACFVEDVDRDVFGECVAFGAQTGAFLVGSVGVVAVFALGGVVLEVPDGPFFLVGQGPRDALCGRGCKADGLG